MAYRLGPAVDREPKGRRLAKWRPAWPAIAVSLLALALFPSCGAGGGAPVASAVSPAWNVYNDSTDGFAISLPASWKAIHRSSATPLVADLKNAASNPDSSDVAQYLLNDPALSSQIYKFIAVDADPKARAGATNTDLPPMVNILKEALPAGTSLDDEARLGLDDLNHNPAIVPPVKEQRVTLPAGPGNEFQFQLRHGGKPTTYVQYSFVRPELNVLQDVVITLAVDPAQAARYEPVFQKIMGAFTLRLVHQRTSFPEVEVDIPELGWTTYYRPADDFSLALPSDWRQEANEPHESMHYAKPGADLELHVTITPLPSDVKLADVIDSVASELTAGPSAHLISQQADALPVAAAEKYVFMTRVSTTSEANLADFHLLWLIVNSGRAYTVHFSWLPLRTDTDPWGKWNDMVRRILWTFRFLGS